MMLHQTSGVLITFCGLDGCGKTTMIGKLSDVLAKQGRTVYLTRQPTNQVRTNPMFRAFHERPQVSEYDYRAVSLMAAADRVQHCNRVILPKLRQGITVISDRYYYSCLANLRARGYEDDRWIYEIADYLPKPDAAFFLDVPAEEAIARVRNRPNEKDRYIDTDLEHRLRQEYRAIAAQFGGILVDATLGEEQTFAQILQQLNHLQLI